MMRQGKRSAHLQAALFQALIFLGQRWPLGLEELEPAEKQRFYRGCARPICVELDIQQQLPIKLIQRRGFKRVDQAPLDQCDDQPARLRGIQPVTEKRHGLVSFGGQVLAGKQQVFLLVDVLKAGGVLHQGHMGVLSDFCAAGEQCAMRISQRFQLRQRLWAAQAQGYLCGLVKMLIEVLQRLLKGRVGHREAVAIAGMKAAQRVLWIDCSQQTQPIARVCIATPGDELGVQHLAFAPLIGDGHARPGEHVAQPLQPLSEDRLRQFEEEVGGAFTGTGIDLAAVTLHERHQVLPGREALGAEEKQMFQKVRQPRPRQRRIVTACGHA
ncbi:hypothetical protein ALP75_201784 [Pseudomonas syringae pv. actinidiae]|nr:hypothetical protein ALP75_201784 [Pseudomonas syringae pv. actinidiae]